MKTTLLKAVRLRAKLVLSKRHVLMLRLLLATCCIAGSMPSASPTAAVSPVTMIRHEINILDGVLMAASGSAADSRELVQLDSSKYSFPAYYFEVVAAASSNCTFTALLRRKGSAIDDAAITVFAGPAYAVFRSAPFSAPAGTTEYMARISGETGCTKNLRAARIVVIDANPTASETQIELGNYEAVIATSPSPLSKPKYWKYSAADWNGSRQFYAEVTYEVANGVASQTFTSNGIFTVPLGATSVTAEAWGGGATGSKGPSQKARGGGGGGGGAYAKRNTISVTPGKTYNVSVAAAVPGGDTPANGNGSAFSGDNGMVSAAGGSVSNGSIGGAGGAIAASSGDLILAGGAGGSSAAANNSGGAGGGSGAGMSAAGNVGSPNANGTGGAGAPAPTGGGDGGHGGNATTNSGISDGFAPGGGGGGAGGGKDAVAGGARGQVKLTWNPAIYIGLYEDDGALGAWKEKTVIEPAGQASSPSRIRVPFTPIDGHTYRIQVGRSDSTATAWLYNAKIVSDLGGEGTVDNYSEANLNRTAGVWLSSSYYPVGAAQSFTGDGSQLKSVKFLLKKYASSSGFAWARIYATTGVFGINSAPTGAPLATSAAFDVSTLSSTSYSLQELTFTETNQITLQSSVHYAVALEYGSPAGDAIIDVGVHDAGASGHEGNLSLRAYGGSPYSGGPDRDLIFHVNSTPAAFSKLEEQYLLANTSLNSGSNLQQTLTKWDPSEWSNVNTVYKHQIDSAAGLSIFELQTAAGALLSGSRVTTDRALASSGIMAMPLTGDLDVNAVLNNDDAYASRIVVSASIILPPQITSITPAFGPPGTLVTITGSGFGASQQASTVSFNGVVATPSSWSDVLVQAPAPAGVTTGDVVVTINGVTSNAVVFTVSPTINAISPLSGPTGSLVAISGQNFNPIQGGGAVTFNGASASIVSWGATSITASVPANASTGPVTVKASGATSNGVTFTVTGPLSITGIGPNPAQTGTTVTVSGANFGAIQGSSTITFNGITASPETWSDSAITVTVPPAASTGPVVITVSGARSNAYPFTTIPSVTTISPASGGPNTFVTLSGTAFGDTRGSSTVTFNGITANPSSWSNTRIVVPAPSNATTGPVTVAVNGQVSNSVTFSFSNVGSISGIVRRSSDNAVLAGAIVQASQAGTLVAATTSAADGSYATPSLQPGSYDITAYADGYLTAMAAGNLISANQITTLPISLSKPVIASVSPPSGPIGTSVTITGADFGSNQGAGQVSFNGAIAAVSAWTESVITVDVPPDASTGEVLVTIDRARSNAVQFTVGTGSVAGTISEFGLGAPVPGALVELLQASSIKASATSSSDGTYNISGIPPGAYEMRVSGNGFGTLVEPNVAVTAGTTSTLDIALTNAGTISGKITRSDGITPIIGAAVNVASANITTATILTNANGDYSCSCVSAGSYDVGASASGYTAQTRRGVSVTAGSITTVDLSLSGQSTISYSYDSLGRLSSVADSLADAATYVYDPVGNLLSISRNSSSQISISGFTPNQGPPGSVVRISGVGFSSDASLNTVRFNGTVAAVTEADPTEIAALVPAAATTGPIVVSSPAGSATSGANFTVTADDARPVITSFDPAIGQASTGVTINGKNFDPTPTSNRLTLNTAFIEPTSVSGTTIALNVPANVGSGRFRLVTPNGEATSSDFFVVPPGYAISKVAYAGRVAIGGTAHVAIGAAGGIGMLVFDGAAGQAISISTSNATISNCGVAVSLFSPTVVAIGSNSCMGNGFLSVQILPATGTYTLLIAAISTASGTLDVTVNNAMAVTGVINPGGAPAPVAISTPGQVTKLIFNGTPGQRISIQTSATSFSACTTLLNPDQTTLAAGGCAANAFIDTVTLQWAGNYALCVSGSGGAIGTVTVRIYDVPADPASPIIPGGSPVTLNIATPGQNAKLTFSGVAGERVSIQTSGVSIQGNWISVQQDPSLLPFIAGQPYNVAMEYFQATQGAIAKLKWSSKSTHFGVKEIVPQRQTTAPGGAAGSGFQAQYYSNTALSGAPSITRIDPTVDFDWAGESPGSPVPATNWSVRWTGQVTPEFSEEYTLCTETDDGVRLWINGKLILDKWQTQAPTEWCYNTPTTLAKQHQTGATYIDTIQLPVSGTYTVLLDPDGAAVGSVTVAINDVPPDASGAIVPGGAPVTLNIAVPGQNGRLIFSGAAGQRVSLQASGSLAGSLVAIQRDPELLPLTPGQQYPIVMEYFQAGQGSTARLKWSNSSTLNQTIPQTQLTPVGGSRGDGLLGEYYANQNLSGVSALTRTDPVVDFGWNNSTPGGGLPGSFWSARWTGEITPQSPEQYTFCTETDDGARLWVNGILLIDKWQTQGVTEWCGNTPLTLVSQHLAGTGYIDTVQLPATGTYSILINPDGASIGDLTVTLNDVPVNASSSIAPNGAPVTLTISTSGQNGRLAFTGAAGQQISIQTSGVSFAGSTVTVVQDPTQLPATAGQLLSIEMQYFQASQGSAARLKWSSPSTLRQVVPQSQLIDPSGAPGAGLQGEYFANQALSGAPELTRIDPTVDFSWAGSTPGGGLPGASWSARWTGQIQAQYSEQYTLCTETDDGARLWVNGSLVLDHWVTQGPTEWCYNAPTILKSQHLSGAGIIAGITLPATGNYTIIVDPDAAATGSMTITLTTP